MLIVLKCWTHTNTQMGHIFCLLKKNRQRFVCISHLSFFLVSHGKKFKRARPTLLSHLKNRKSSDSQFSFERSMFSKHTDQNMKKLDTMTTLGTLGTTFCDSDSFSCLSLLPLTCFVCEKVRKCFFYDYTISITKAKRVAREWGNTWYLLNTKKEKQTETYELSWERKTNVKKYAHINHWKSTHEMYTIQSRRNRGNRYSK